MVFSAINWWGIQRRVWLLVWFLEGGGDRIFYIMYLMYFKHMQGKTSDLSKEFGMEI